MAKYIGVEVDDDGNVGVGFVGMDAVEAHTLLSMAQSIITQNILKKKSVITPGKLPFNPEILRGGKN